MQSLVYKVRGCTQSLRTSEEAETDAVAAKTAVYGWIQILAESRSKVPTDAHSVKTALIQYSSVITLRFPSRQVLQN